MSILILMVGGTGLEAICDLFRHIRDYAMVMLERKRFRGRIRRKYGR